MKTIIYCRKGISVGDYEAENVLDEFINSNEKELTVSSIFIITTFKRYVLEGVVDCNDYEVFVSNDYDLIKLEFDDDGFVTNMPITIIDKTINYFSRKAGDITVDDDDYDMPMDVGITDIDSGII